MPRPVRIIGLLAACTLGSVQGLTHAGQEVHCIRGKAHLVSFSITGEPTNGSALYFAENGSSSMENIEHAVVSMATSSAHDADCHTPSGRQWFCAGANQDDSCKKAKKKMLHLKEGLKCKNCFVSVEADTFYKLNYSKYRLNTLEVGMNNLKLMSSATVHKPKTEEAVLIDDSYLMNRDDDWKQDLIDVKVGCPLCIKVKVSVDLKVYLDYKVTANCQGEFNAGAEMKMNLGDNWVRYSSRDGWRNTFSGEFGKPQVHVTPFLNGGHNVDAGLTLRTRTSLQIKLNKMAWYHFDIAPTLPLHIREERKDWPWPFHLICLKGDAALDLEQEANIDWNFWFFSTSSTWGPSKIHEWKKEGIVDRCKPIIFGAAASLEPPGQTPLLLV